MRSNINPTKKKERFRFSFFRKHESIKEAKIQTIGLMQKAKILDSMKNIRFRILSL
jgi:hypothetical protein